jgi:hypothetical protein
MQDGISKDLAVAATPFMEERPDDAGSDEVKTNFY